MEYRYALGLQDIDEGIFELHTINFRSVVTAYKEEHGVNLIRKISVQITDAQQDYFQVRTGMQRVDSTLERQQYPQDEPTAAAGRDHPPALPGPIC